MGEELMNYVKHPLTRKDKTLSHPTLKGMDALSKILMMVKDHSGIDFSYYKENTVNRRLERRVSINRFNGLKDYIPFLSGSDKEKDILYREFLIGVTHFFRDKEAFESLEKNVISKLVKSDKKQLRVWSTGCSTGEEAYSLAILFMEWAEKENFRGEIKINWNLLLETFLRMRLNLQTRDLSNLVAN
jgi:two-component system CheB/CheR fusion protein